MKKLAAIFLLAVFAFNLFGYRFVVDFMQHRADARLEARLDHKLYDESQLIELKVPVNLPYQTSRASYERYDGEIELNGTLYKYVERKLSDDTLYLKCLPNTNKMHLETAKDDFFKNSNDLAQNNNSKKSGSSKTPVFKKILSEYNEHTSVYNSKITTEATYSFNSYVSPELLFSAHISPEQPPDFILS